MSMIDNDWLPAIQGEFRKPYYRELYTFVREEYSRTVVYPPARISLMPFILRRLVR